MNDILNAVMYILAAIGMGCIAIVIYELLARLKDSIIDSFRRQKSKYIIKHRFSKPPTAKCYCIDCIYHDDETNICYRHDRWYTGSTMFCCDAEPRKNVEERENKDD